MNGNTQKGCHKPIVQQKTIAAAADNDDGYLYCSEQVKFFANGKPL